MQQVTIKKHSINTPHARTCVQTLLYEKKNTMSLLMQMNAATCFVSCQEECFITVWDCRAVCQSGERSQMLYVTQFPGHVCLAALWCQHTSSRSWNMDGVCSTRTDEHCVTPADYKFQSTPVCDPLRNTKYTQSMSGENTVSEGKKRKCKLMPENRVVEYILTVFPSLACVT